MLQSSCVVYMCVHVCVCVDVCVGIGVGGWVWVDIHACVHVHVRVCVWGEGGEWLGLGLWGCVSVGCVCVYIQYTLRCLPYTVHSAGINTLKTLLIDVGKLKPLYIASS